MGSKPGTKPRRTGHSGRIDPIADYTAPPATTIARMVNNDRLTTVDND
ncbi:hypothetical protein LV79_002542 [Actinokineospora globicatena]|nr:hypothetical protein [Actinokineospora globicatena]